MALTLTSRTALVVAAGTIFMQEDQRLCQFLSVECLISRAVEALHKQRGHLLRIGPLWALPL